MNIHKSFASVPYRLGLYPVVDSLAWIVRMLESGVTTIQLRIKNRRESEMDADIEAAVLLGRRYGARIFINDYWKLAINYGAYGVHLGQEDMNTVDVNALHDAGLRLGLSTHSEKELERALSWKPSYISLGHIFPTNTKFMPSNPQGLETLRHLVTRIPSIPTVAIGGITHQVAEKVLACGVGSIAVVSAITNSKNWRQSTSNLLALIAAWENHNHGE